MGVGAMIGAASYHVATCPQGPSFCLNGIGGDRATLAVIGAAAGLLGGEQPSELCCPTTE